MIKYITAALLALAAAGAAAQQSAIYTNEGNITLQSQPCRDGGKEAVMIYSTRQGGAYGCWFTTPTHIVIKWDVFIGANGHSLNANGFTTKYPKN